MHGKREGGGGAQQYKRDMVEPAKTRFFLSIYLTSCPCGIRGRIAFEMHFFGVQRWCALFQLLVHKKALASS